VRFAGSGSFGRFDIQEEEVDSRQLKVESGRLAKAALVGLKRGRDGELTTEDAEYTELDTARPEKSKVIGGGMWKRDRKTI
jgi:hypothetical protein